MEIIKRVEPHKSWEKEVTCKCTSVLKIETSDVSYQPSSGGQFDAYFFYTCPVCKTANPIPDDQLSEFVQKWIREHSNCGYQNER